MDLTPPIELVGALGRAGLTLTGPVGAGANGPRWSARDDDGRRWTVTLVPSGAEAQADGVRRRVEQLRQVRHPHLQAVGEVLELPGWGLGVLHEEVPGADLATVCSVKGDWRPGEVVTVVVPVAEALASLHAAGLCHGDVSAANVVLTPDGRAVLVDLLGGGDPDERGTPVTAAPERASGASAAGDVHGVGALGIGLLAPRMASRAAGPSVPAEARVRAALGEATAVEPGQRPTAAQLAAAVYAGCPPEPVDLPDPGVLARAALVRLAGGGRAQQTQRIVRSPRRRRRGRHRRATPGRRLVACAAVLAVAGVGVVTGPVAPGGRGAGPSSSGQVVRDGRPDPVTAALDLTRRRTSALVAGDLAALRAVTVPGSRAAGADVAALAAARRHPVAGPRGATPAPRIEILELGRVPPAVDPAPTSGCPVCALVLISAEVSIPGAAPAPARPVVLVLAPVPGGWRVMDVQAPDR